MNYNLIKTISLVSTVVSLTLVGNNPSAQAQIISGTAADLQQPSSYLGIGGNIGIDGNSTAIGDGGFAILGKVGVIKHLSLRPSIIINDYVAGNLAVTGDLPIKNQDKDQVIAVPYLGGGIVIHDQIDPLLTAGVDIPLTSKLTGNAQINVGFSNDTDVGLMLGVGYNFGLF